MNSHSPNLETIEFRFPNLHSLLEPPGTTDRINAILRACRLLSPMSERHFGIPITCTHKQWDESTREDVVVVTGPKVAIARVAEHLAMEMGPRQLEAGSRA